MFFWSRIQGAERFGWRVKADEAAGLSQTKFERFKIDKIRSVPRWAAYIKELLVIR